MRKSLFGSGVAAMLAAAALAMPGIAETMPSIPTRPRRQAKPWQIKRFTAQEQDIANWNAAVDAKNKHKLDKRARQKAAR